MKPYWAKRRAKFRGFCNHLYSWALLRYTPMHGARLKKYFLAHPVERLHVGCGLLLLKGWCNVLYETGQEYGVYKNIDGAGWLNYDLLRSWPWAPGSLAVIAGSHFIEHLDLNDGLAFCREAYKALRPTGIIRLSCPDLETYAVKYLKQDRQFFQDEEIRKACAFQAAETPSQIFAAKAYDCGGAHQWFHDFSSLKNILERAGFAQIRRVKRLEGLTPDLEKLEPPQREIETVYVEAVKA